MKILLTGGSGQIGSAFQRLAPSEWTIEAPDRTTLDITKPHSIVGAVNARSWDAIVNAAAYTAVDKAEDDVLATWQTNALAPAILARESARANIPLLHLSTDYVFDGKKPTPYVEDDAVCPLGVYGASKEAGEQAVRTANPLHIILRTAWVVSAHGNNFVKTMLRLGAERPHLRVVSDQQGSPTSAADVALALNRILPSLIKEPVAVSGTYHFVNDGEASWYDLANFVFSTAAEQGAKVPTVEAISTAEYRTAAVRPANSRLSSEKLRRIFAITPRPWKAAIGDVVRDLVRAAKKE